MYSTVSGPTHPPLAFGYCRKSTTGQREESIEAQQRAIVAYAAAMGYQLVHIYKDHGNSGRSGERPEFQQMLQDAVPAGVQFIIVHKLDRFFRNAERQTLIEAQLRRQGIHVLSASEHFDDTPQGQFMRNITKAINQWYSANLATEVMKGMRENAMGARNTGGPPPLGYAVDKTTGKFVLQPTEAAAVQMIFRMYRQGCGYTEIIDALNAAGHVTRRGRPFGKNSLYDILRNEKYTGTYVWNRLAPADPDGRTNRRNLKPRSEWVCVEGGMPQIITPEEFKEVQAEMNNRKHRSAAYTAKAFYLLSGLVYCGGCGGSMSGEAHRYKSHGKPVEYRYYTCSAKKRLHADGEHARPVPAASLEGAVVDYLQRVIFNPANMDTLCAALLQSMEPDPRHTDLAADLKRQAAEVQLKIDRIYAAIEKGLCRYGVIPLENSTAGSVNAVYDLMMQHNFRIVRSVRLKIDHCLLAKPGTKLSDIKEIYSHEQAISQCGRFLQSLPGVTVVRCENTAVAAKRVAESDRTDIAALSSRACVGLYGLESLASSVQDQGNNYTRFICIAKDLEIYPGADRTSLMMVLPHKPGSLYKVLSRFYALGINMNKLESRPLPERDFEFMFYFDLETSVYSPQFQQLMGELPGLCEEFSYLGSYREVV